MGVKVSHLKSYENMGVARISCESGCKCIPTLVNGTSEKRTSTLHMHDMQASTNRPNPSNTHRQHHKRAQLDAAHARRAGKCKLSKTVNRHHHLNHPDCPNHQHHPQTRGDAMIERTLTLHIHGMMGPV